MSSLIPCVANHPLARPPVPVPHRPRHPTHPSGSIDKAKLLEAVKAMNLSMADGEKIYLAICKEQGAENGITFAMFKNACKVAFIAPSLGLLPSRCR